MQAVVDRCCRPGTRPKRPLASTKYGLAAPDRYYPAEPAAAKAGRSDETRKAMGWVAALCGGAERVGAGLARDAYLGARRQRLHHEL